VKGGVIPVNVNTFEYPISAEIPLLKQNLEGALIAAYP
jgi:hypothetical protein